MPEVKIKHVISCSSEDKNFCSDNLLKPDGTKKWLTATPGERQASVTLQFEKAEKIQGIDIGNNGSAFVEVLVAKSSDKSENDFQVLLVASSFMSPLESKSGTNQNRVRMFGMDKLSNAAVDHKWNIVKIVCTQPFNRSVTYGLSFIKFFSEANRQEKPQIPTEDKPVSKLGAFKLKNEDESSDGIKTGCLFANRSKEKTNNAEILTGAAAVRAASRLADEASTSQSSQPTKVVKTEQSRTPAPVKRKSEEPYGSIEKKRLSSSSSLTSSSTPSSGQKPSMRKQSTDSSRSSDRDAVPPIKKSLSESMKTPSRVPLNKLMSKVVFVMSGFQNPTRGDLRDRALEMGAKYRPDWGQGCTHLICAFANTPKYNTVNGKKKKVPTATLR